MTKRALAPMLMLAFTLTFQSVALGQAKTDQSPQTVQDWQGLRDLKQGKRLIIYTKQGKEIDGYFAGITGSTLNLHNFPTMALEQRDLEAVRLWKGPQKKGRIIGTIVGFFAGGFIGGYIGIKIEERQMANGVFSDSPGGAPAALGLFGGATLGYVIGSRIDHGAKGKLLYKSR